MPFRYVPQTARGKSEMKALCFGGAFNPPTKAHIELADEVRMRLGFDRVLYIPTKYEYIRFDEGKDYAYPDEVRLAMLEKIAAQRDWMIVTDYEIRQESQPRTYRTLQHFSQEYELKLLIGSDWLRKLETGWSYVEEICREFGIVIMERSGDNAAQIIEESPYLSSLKEYLTVVTLPDVYHNVSSTLVRSAVSQIREARGYIRRTVPDEIADILVQEDN